MDGLTGYIEKVAGALSAGDAHLVEVFGEKAEAVQGNKGEARQLVADVEDLFPGAAEILAGEIEYAEPVSA